MTPPGYHFVDPAKIPNAALCKFIVRYGEEFDLPEDVLDDFYVPITIELGSVVAPHEEVEATIQSVAATVGLAGPVDIGALDTVTVDAVLAALGSGQALVGRLDQLTEPAEIDLVVIAGPLVEPRGMGYGGPGDPSVVVFGTRPDGRTLGGYVSNHPDFDYLADAAALLEILQTATVVE